MAKYETNVSGAILLPSSIQVTESISGSVVPLAMFGNEVLSHIFQWTRKFPDFASSVAHIVPEQSCQFEVNKLVLSDYLRMDAESQTIFQM